jgi:uncharacterized protein (TIGR00369 family)
MAGAELDDDTFLADRDGVGACFGCGPANESGLRLRFRLRADGSVETRLAPGRWLAGIEGILHGGIQATLLDEVMGVAAQLSLPPGSSRAAMVTAELNLRFLRPVGMDDEVVAVARVVGIEGPDVHVQGEIVACDGTELTTAEARWRLPRGARAG